MRRAIAWAVVAVATSLLPVHLAMAEPVETVLRNFNREQGRPVLGPLAVTADGTLFGSAADGGGFGHGVAFRLTPPPAGQTEWSETILRSFFPADGRPSSPVILGGGGVLYGATAFAPVLATDPVASARIYRLTPPVQPGGRWTQTILYTLTNPTGAAPGVLSLVTDSHGNIYGNAVNTGRYSVGSIVRLSPPTTTGGQWNLSVLHSFRASEGYLPYSPLLLRGPYGATTLYGTTFYGAANRCGAIWRLIEPPGGRGEWSYEVLHVFTCDAEGGAPTSALIADTKSNLYGTTPFFEHSRPTVFRLSPPGPGQTSWTYTVLRHYSVSDGFNPVGPLLLHSDGRLYGTTATNAIAPCYCGTVFRLTPTDDAGQQTPWNLATLYRFHGPDGAHPSGVIVDPASQALSLIGVTSGGGTLVPLKAPDPFIYGGTVFRLTP